jgi:hypothetical protein
MHHGGGLLPKFHDERDILVVWARGDLNPHVLADTGT